MRILGGFSDFFGLDISSSAVRVVQLKGPGPLKTLDLYGEAMLEGTIALSDAPVDRQKVGAAVHELVKKTGLTTKNVAVNLPSNRVFTTIVEWDRMPPLEMAKSINYQAESLIPTPPDKSKIDWAVIGDSPKDPKKVEILLSSATNDFIEARLDMLESVGLNVIAFEPEGMAIARSLVPPESTVPQVVLDIGKTSMDIIVTMDGTPRLSRIIPIGLQTMTRAVVQNMNIDEKQAEQFVVKFGLGKDKMEGQIYKSILGTVENLMAEIEKSIQYFQGRYANAKLDKIIVTGGASALPEFPLYIANRFGLNVEIGNSWRNVSYPADRQDELMGVSNHFAVAVGLAERTE